MKQPGTSHMEQRSKDGPQDADENPLVAFSKGLISRHQAIEALGVRDYASLLVMLGDADLPMPLPPEEELESQAQMLVDLMNHRG